MSSNVYRKTEIVGSSPDSVEDAIKNGVSRAAKTLRNVEWFEVSEIRGHVVDGAVEYFQVGMKVGFKVDD